MNEREMRENVIKLNVDNLVRYERVLQSHANHLFVIFLASSSCKTFVPWQKIITFETRYV